MCVSGDHRASIKANCKLVLHDRLYTFVNALESGHTIKHSYIETKRTYELH